MTTNPLGRDSHWPGTCLPATGMEHLRQLWREEGLTDALRRVSKSDWPFTPPGARLGFLLGTVVFLYLSLFVATFGPIYRNSDQLIYLENAMKLLEGQTMYRDFFQFTTPGTEFVYFCLFKLAGVHVWLPSVVLLLLGVGFVWLGLSIGRRLISGTHAFLPGLLFLTYGYFWWLDGTHHWFSSLCVMAALAILLETRSTARLVAAGALCGLALCFTQVRGLMAILGISVYLIWEYRNKNQTWGMLVKNQVCALGAFLALVLGFNAYFAWKAGLAQFLWCTITFGIKYYSAWPGNTWRMLVLDFPRLHSRFLQPPRVAVYLFNNSIAPLVYVVFICRYQRLKRSHPLEPWDRLMLVNLIGTSLFIGIAPALGELRSSSSCLPALVLMVWILRSWGRLGKGILYAFWVTALALAVVEPVSRQTHWQAHLDLPTGRMAIFDPVSYEMHRWLLERTKPSEYFFEEEVPRMYFTLDLRNPAPVPFVTNTEYTRPEQVQGVIQALGEHRVRLVMVSPFRDLPIGGRDWGDHLGPLRTYLGTHYHVVKTFDNGEQVWEREEAER